jgi:hypothetical protein
MVADVAKIAAEQGGSGCDETKHECVGGLKSSTI